MAKKKTVTKKAPAAQAQTKKKASAKKTSTSGAAASSKKKAPVKKAPAKPKELPYPEVDAMLFTVDNPLTVAKAKELLDWVEEGENTKFGVEYLFKDRHGKKVRCLNNTTNRPFNVNLARDWMLEILRRKWKMNGMPAVIDRTGQVQDGQHRLIGLVWAAQEVELHGGQWKEFWQTEPTMPILVVVGIDETDETINTIGTGKPRSLADVIYRSEFFAKKPSRERARISRVAQWSTKFLQKRTAANLVGYGTRRPHSEALDFIEAHPHLLEAINTIWDEDCGKEGRLVKYLPLGIAAGALYLMGSCASDSDEYDKVNNEMGLEWSMWDKACEFWVELACGKKLAGLQDVLVKIDKGGQFANDAIYGNVAKAWNLFAEGKPVTAKAVALRYGKDEFECPVLLEKPYVGGIDVGEHHNQPAAE